MKPCKHRGAGCYVDNKYCPWIHPDLEEAIRCKYYEPSKAKKYDNM